MAMYTAKERGRNALAYYDERMSHRARRTALEAELRHALERHEFEVYYQPIIDVASRRIVGAEALVRWHHPARGLVLPDVFIGMCESTGLIVPLGRLVFDTAARQQAAWLAAGHDLMVSVNLSARQLRHSGLLDELRDMLHTSGADPRRIQLEITESMLLGLDGEMQALLQDIQRWACASRWTTSAPVIPTWPTCSGFPFPRSRSTAASCRASKPTGRWPN
jgi:sensor c-di-GMP phosphodiesterase-like protein